MRKIELKYIVKKDEGNMRVGNILLNRLKVSHRLLNKLKMNEKVLVNNKPVFSNYIVQENDIITAKIDFEEQDFIVPEQINLNILYEDDYLIAVNKPAGIVVHPCSNHTSGTLANGLKYYLNNNKKIRAINRLDKDTTGIVLFAKNEYIQELFIKHIKIEKEYIAIVEGKLTNKVGTINEPISRKKDSIMEREISEEGQIAITHYEVIKEINDKNISLIKLQLETGRTHQIRVHMAYIGNSILGDTLYGNKSELIARQALHAYRIKFEHPIYNKEIIIEAPIPDDMRHWGRRIMFLQKNIVVHY